MSRLDSGKRADLPDSAFAYVDSRGRRRLPIHDESHVRNALARFNQVSFENDDARERARLRLLQAAKKYGIVPVGFITSQLQAERAYAELRATATDAATLPTGFVTLLMTDIEGSTTILDRVGERYRDLLNDVRGILRDGVKRSSGTEIDARADEFFAVFENAVDAICAAIAVQHTMSERQWPDDLQVCIRMGLHSGEPTLTDVGYIGMAVHAAARVCSAGHGGQIVVSGETREAAAATLPEGIVLRSLGLHRLRGVPDAQELFQVEAPGLRSTFPPPNTGGRVNP